jgi:hypothetical protein
VPEANAFPSIVESAPCGHAMKVGSRAKVRLLEKLRPGPQSALFNEAADRQRPIGQSDGRVDAEVEHGPAFCDMLTGREPTVPNPKIRRYALFRQSPLGLGPGLLLRDESVVRFHEASEEIVSQRSKTYYGTF